MSTAYVRFDVFTAMPMKNAAFWGVLQLLVTANVVPSSPILVTLMMEVIRSYDMLVLTRATQHNIPEDSIFILLSNLPEKVFYPKDAGSKANCPPFTSYTPCNINNINHDNLNSINFILQRN
jgi:hypothetical protein